MPLIKILNAVKNSDNGKKISEKMQKIENNFKKSIRCENVFKKKPECQKQIQKTEKIAGKIQKKYLKSFSKL